MGNSLNNLLPVIRRAKGIKQVDLAKSLSISPSYLCRIERGLLEAPDELKAQCSEILGVTVNELFPDEKINTDRNFSNSTSNNLWQIRMKKKLKQNQLAILMDCSPSYISKIEKGLQAPNDKFRKKCAKILKVKESEIFPKN